MGKEVRFGQVATWDMDVKKLAGEFCKMKSIHLKVTEELIFNVNINKTR